MRAQNTKRIGLGPYFAKCDAKFTIGLEKTKFSEINAKFPICQLKREISFAKFVKFRLRRGGFRANFARISRIFEFCFVVSDAARVFIARIIILLYVSLRLL